MLRIIGALIAAGVISNFAWAQDIAYTCTIRASENLISCERQGKVKPVFQYKLPGLSSLQDAPELDKQSKLDGIKLETYRHAVEKFRVDEVERFRRSPLEGFRRKVDALLASGSIDPALYRHLIELYADLMAQSYRVTGLGAYRNAMDDYRHSWPTVDD